jgi:hypothetical protein
MRDNRPFFRRPGCLLALAVLIAVPSLVAIAIWNEIRPYYTHVDLLRLPSPNGAWTAIVTEDTVDYPLWVTVTASVVLASKERPTVTTDLLQIYTDGHNNLRPRIAWFAPNVLRVTVANLSRIEVIKRHVDGVDVDIQFDPDDPPARAAWLKRTGRTPD